MSDGNASTQPDNKPASILSQLISYSGVVKKPMGLMGVVGATALMYAAPKSRKRKLALSALAAGSLGYWLMRQKKMKALVHSEYDPPEYVRQAVADGILMRWEEHGKADGLPVVFIHGIPTHPRLWRHVIAGLKGLNIRCLAWEQVGYGWSMDQGLKRDISIARQAEYLHSWLKQIGVKRAVFVGHDLGGGVIQRFAVAHPEMCAGLVFTNCIAYDNWPVPMVQASRAMRSLVAQLPPSLLKPIFTSALARLGHDKVERGAESVALHWKPYDRAEGPKAFAHQLKCLDFYDTQEISTDLPHLHIPARVVWGDSGPLSLKSGERLATDLRTPIQRIRGGRHFTPEDHPDEIAQAIRSLLDEITLKGEEPLSSANMKALDAQY